MKGSIRCLLVVLCCLNFVLTVLGDDSDFIDEKGKALRNLKVVPGTKRNNVDYHTVEQEAGRAVLKLLDAKIGKKVNDAAKEVTDFLNDAVGHHAQQRTAHIQSDKEKEMSLLHLGTKKVLSHQDEENKPKKNKDGTFLVNLKIPYIVTPVDEKKKPKAKKYHHKHGKKPHLKKYHHRILHHHHHHQPHAMDASRHPVSSPYNQQTQAPQAQGQPQSYNAIDLTFNGNSWTYNYANDTSSNMVPCQGNCMGACTQECSMNQDCCCCDPNMMAQTQMAAAQPSYPPVAPPAYQPAPMPAGQPSPGLCPLGCDKRCFTYCPRGCCGLAGKRDKVIKNVGSGSEEETADQQKDNGSGSDKAAEEKPEQSQVESSESTKAAENSDKTAEIQKTEKQTDSPQEGSSESESDDVENDE